MTDQGKPSETAAQIAWHQRWAGLLHDHATWATLATVVVLVAKYLFQLPITQAEVLAFAGIMATAIFGARWAQAAHIEAMSSLASSAVHMGGLAAAAGSLASVARLLEQQAGTDTKTTTSG